MSGWYWRASFRYDVLIACESAFRSIPRISYGSLFNWTVPPPSGFLPSFSPSRRSFPRPRSIVPRVRFPTEEENDAWKHVGRLRNSRSVPDHPRRGFDPTTCWYERANQNKGIQPMPSWIAGTKRVSNRIEKWTWDGVSTLFPSHEERWGFPSKKQNQKKQILVPVCFCFCFCPGSSSWFSPGWIDPVQEPSFLFHDPFDRDGMGMGPRERERRTNKKNQRPSLVDACGAAIFGGCVRRVDGRKKVDRSGSVALDSGGWSGRSCKDGRWERFRFHPRTRIRFFASWSG